MKLAEQIVNQLMEAGVQRIYGIVGDSLNPVVDAVRATGGSKKGGIDWVHVRHEEAAAFAAGADAQLTGKLAVCAGSCGPGNMHLINGLYDAHRSGAPVLAIASHIPSVQIGQQYFQETRPQQIFEECSVYNEMVLSTDQSPRVFASAIRHALADRGVAVVTLPGDLADQEASAKTPALGTLRRAPKVPTDATIAELATEINSARRIALFVGIGIDEAHDEVIELASRVNAPIGHSLRGKDFIQYENPYDVGMTGLLGYGAAAWGIDDADLMIMIGTDFPYDQFLPETKTVQIDTEPGRMGRRTDVDLQIEGSAQQTLQKLLPAIEQKSDRTWLEKVLAKHDSIMDKAVGAYTRKVEKKKPIHPEFAASLLDEVAAEDAIFTADTGMCNVWSARYIRPLGTRRLIGSYLHGSMANAMPQSIGAQLAYPDRQVISISGDGGLSMLLGDLITIASYQLPANIVVFNNSTLGMVKLEMLVDGLEDFGVDVPDTHYADIATAMGFHAVRVSDPKKLKKAYEEALAHPGPSLVEVITDPMSMSVPPKVNPEMIFGFATAMSKVVLGGGAGEAVSMARSNLRNIQAVRQW